MLDTTADRLARVLVEYSLAVRRGELVTVEAPLAVAGFARELARYVVRAGAHAVCRLTLEELALERVGRGTPEQVEWLDPFKVEGVEHADASVAVLAPGNTRGWSGVPAERQASAVGARRPLVERLAERERAGSYRWVVTAFPTAAAAQEARMSLDDYASLVARASLLDRDDPVAAWRALGEHIARVAGRLEGTRELRIEAPGTDLILGVEGRHWVASDGRANMPDGECFTAPLEDAVDGVVTFGVPAMSHGRVVEGARLVLEGGRVVDASARRGEELLLALLDTDEGSRRLGEVAFGLNDALERATGEALLDEKMGGTAHVAIGDAYEETGGRNRSALHWDLVLDLRTGGRVYADGELVLEDGRFLAGL